MDGGLCCRDHNTHPCRHWNNKQTTILYTSKPAHTIFTWRSLLVELEHGEGSRMSMCWGEGGHSFLLPYLIWYSYHVRCCNRGSLHLVLYFKCLFPSKVIQTWSMMQNVNRNFGLTGTLEKTQFQALPHRPALAISYWCNALITVNVYVLMCVWEMAFSFSLSLSQVMLVGDSGVGKTCLLVRFKDGAFLAGSFISTVGIDFRVQILSVSLSLSHKHTHTHTLTSLKISPVAGKFPVFAPSSDICCQECLTLLLLLPSREY